MESKQSPRVSFFIPAAVIMMITGWVGLAILLWSTLPTVGPRWLFFFLSVLALTGTSLPITAFLNRRFPTSPPASPTVVLREAIWVGVFGATLAWLQIGRVLTSALAILLLIGLALIEFLLRLSEKSQWKP